jgi:hypothetical protein
MTNSTVPKISLPRIFEGHSLAKVAADVVACSPNRRPGELASIVFDFSDLTFVHPSGIVFLSNLIDWLELHGTEVQLGALGTRSAALSFLDDSLFFHYHCGNRHHRARRRYR